MSVIQISPAILSRIQAYGEEAYPEEGAGFLIGSGGDLLKQVVDVLPISNAREESARHDRYIITVEDYVKGESTADRLGLGLIGVFHSHPDHPNQPSEYDREWAQPFFSYIITCVQSGKAVESRSWLLSEDRTRFDEEEIKITGVSQ